MAPILAGCAQSARRHPSGGENRQRSAPRPGWSLARGFVVGAQLIEADPVTGCTRTVGRRKSPMTAVAAAHDRGRAERRDGEWRQGKISLPR
jgi:hypothetical protein